MATKTAMERRIIAQLKLREEKRLINVKGKSKRFKQSSGKRSDWKKAFVSLQAGQDIDFTVTE